MVASQTNLCLKKADHRKMCGFTLIEVLIALAIIGIAMTAVIKATSQNIRSTSYLQDKTMAMWVGQEVLNEARVDVLHLPLAPDNLKEVKQVLGRDWYFTALQEKTPNKNIRKIMVSVYSRSPDSLDDATPLMTLESFVYHEPKN